jgi:hypothetical protein
MRANMTAQVLSTKPLHLVDVRNELLGLVSIFEVLLSEPGDQNLFFNLNPMKQNWCCDQHDDKAVEAVSDHRD